MPRRQKKYHYIYKTTCVITGKFYVGMHSTDNLQDGYLGSGKILGYSRRKHGDENHKLEVLEMCGSREQLKQREKEIVNEELLAHPLNMNLKYGGEGGWDYLNDGSESHRRRASQAATTRNLLHMKPGSAFAKQIAQKSINTKRLRGNGNWFGGKYAAFTGRKHSAVARAKISESMKTKQTGSRNSQFGTCWICNSTGAIKVKSSELQKFLQIGYKRGRKYSSD